jgi:hypothetical protein
MRLLKGTLEVDSKFVCLSVLSLGRRTITSPLEEVMNENGVVP